MFTGIGIILQMIFFTTFADNTKIRTSSSTKIDAAINTKFDT